MTRDPDAHLHDAVMAAAARDQTHAQTGRRRDNLRFLASLPRVIWWLRRSEKARDGNERDR